MSISDIYRGITKSEVFSGDTILFWKDNWNKDVYADKYPRAFSYIHHEDLSVRDFLTTATLHETFQLPLSVQAHDELKLLQLDVADVSLDDREDVWAYC